MKSLKIVEKELSESEVENSFSEDIVDENLSPLISYKRPGHSNNNNSSIIITNNKIDKKYGKESDNESRNNNCLNNSNSVYYTNSVIDSYLLSPPMQFKGLEEEEKESSFRIKLVPIYGISEESEKHTEQNISSQIHDTHINSKQMKEIETEYQGNNIEETSGNTNISIHCNPGIFVNASYGSPKESFIDQYIRTLKNNNKFFY